MERTAGWGKTLGIEVGDDEWALEVRGLRKRRDDGSRPVRAKFENASAEFTDEVTGTLRWELLGLVTNRFELSVTNDRFTLDLRYKRSLLSPWLDAKASIVARDSGDSQPISFELSHPMISAPTADTPFGPAV